MSTTKEAAVASIGGTGSTRRRGTTGPKAGSVWETRMKLDEFKGGIKVFDATHEVPHLSPQKSSANSSPEPQMEKKLNNSSNGGVKAKQAVIGTSGKRKTWKSENVEGSPNPMIRIARQRSESSRNFEQQPKEIGVSADEMKDSRSDDGKCEELKGSSDLGEMKYEPSDGNSADQLVTVLERKVLEGNRITNSVTDEANNSRSDDQRCEQKKAISSNAIEVETKNLDVKETVSEEQKPKKIVVEEKKLVHSNEKPTNQTRFHQIPTKSNPSKSSGRIPRTNGKLQSFVDLVMWRDVSKSAFVFGIGTFAIISSSFTNDLNISFISVVSYMGLVYLAANFLFKSLISRGSSMEMNNGSNQENYVVGEEEAIWVIKLLLPYVNEFLVNLRALFSGDPATTMKLAVLLFILAQCGSSITIWKMAKLGFFGVFIVPKVCSSYSSQIAAYGTFWARRFGDAWKSCSHKKVVGFVVFTLVWNWASLVARAWIVFMLLAAFKYHQRSLATPEGCRSEEMESSERSWQQGQYIVGRQRNVGRSPGLAYAGKQKKVL